MSEVIQDNNEPESAKVIDLEKQYDGKNLSKDEHMEILEYQNNDKKNGDTQEEAPAVDSINMADTWTYLNKKSQSFYNI